MKHPIYLLTTFKIRGAVGAARSQASMARDGLSKFGLKCLK